MEKTDELENLYLLQKSDIKKASIVAADYQYKVDLAINQTKYGQQAMVLDTAGNLAQLNKRIVDGEAVSVYFAWMGHDYDTADPDD